MLRRPHQGGHAWQRGCQFQSHRGLAEPRLQRLSLGFRPPHSQRAPRVRQQLGRALLEPQRRRCGRLARRWQR
jgi:hypothetical protein